MPLHRNPSSNAESGHPTPSPPQYMFLARARLLRHSSRHPWAVVAAPPPPCPRESVSSRTGVKPARPARSCRLEQSPDQPSTESVFRRCRIFQRAAGDRHAALLEAFRYFFPAPQDSPATPPRPHLVYMQQPRDQAHQRCAWSAATGSVESAVGSISQPSHASACPRLPRVRRQAILADLVLPFISRVGPFHLAPITRIRRQSPTAAEPPPRPAPSMARIARTLPKRATAACLSRTAGNLSRIPGRSQRERHSCRKKPQPSVSCHQPTPQALRRIERRAQSAALARIAGCSLRAAGRHARVWLTRPEEPEKQLPPDAVGFPARHPRRGTIVLGRVSGHS